jgi:hypothetical protein
MVLAGIKVPDTVLVRDAIDLARSVSEPFLFNHAMRSWLFSVLLSEGAEPAPDPESLAVATILHDLGLTDRYTAENRFEVDGANAARSFLKGRGISTQQAQVVWDAIALHTTRSIALHKEPEVAMTHSGVTVDVLGAGLDRIPQDKQGAILAEFPRLALKNGLRDCLCNIVRRKPATTFDNIVRDFGVRYVEGYTFRIDGLPIIELRTRVSAAEEGENMNYQIQGLSIHAEVRGTAEPALVFLHYWGELHAPGARLPPNLRDSSRQWPMTRVAGGSPTRP